MEGFAQTSIIGDKKFREVLLLCLVNSVFLSFAHIFNSSIAIYVASISICVQILLTPENYYFPVVLYYYNWSTIMRVSATSTSIATYCSILYLFVFLLRRNFRSSPKVLVPSALLFIVSLVGSFFSGDVFSTSFIKFLSMLIFTPLYYNAVKDIIDFKICVWMCVLGIFTSFGTALIFSKYTHLSEFLQVSYSFSGAYTRMAGLTAGDSNGSASWIIVGIGSLLVMFDRENIKAKLLSVTSIVLLIICAFQSVSKAFLFTLALTLIAYGVFFLFSSKIQHKGLVFIFLAVAATVFLSLPIVRDSIDVYLIRLEQAESSGDLTTGRTAIWKNYLSYFFSSPRVLLIGNGLSSRSVSQVSAVYYCAAHNTLLQIIFQCGVVGGAVLFYWLGNFKGNKHGANFKRTAKIVLLMISYYLMWLSLDRMFFDAFFYTILLFAIGRNWLTNNA